MTSLRASGWCDGGLACDHTPAHGRLGGRIARPAPRPYLGERSRIALELIDRPRSVRPRPRMSALAGARLSLAQWDKQHVPATRSAADLAAHRARRRAFRAALARALGLTDAQVAALESPG